MGGSGGADWWADVSPKMSPRGGSSVALKGLHCSSSSHRSVLGDFPCLRLCASTAGGPGSTPGWAAKVPNHAWCVHRLQKCILGRARKNYRLCLSNKQSGED